MKPSLPSRLARVLLAALLLAGSAHITTQRGEVLDQFVLHQMAEGSAGELDETPCGTTAPTTWGLAALVGYAGVVEGVVGDGHRAGQAIPGGSAGTRGLTAVVALPHRRASLRHVGGGVPSRHLHCVYRL